MVFVMIGAGVLAAAVLEELVLDRVRLRRGAAAGRPAAVVDRDRD